MKKFLWIILTVGLIHAGWIIKIEERPKDMKPETSTVYVSKGKVVNESKDGIYIIDFKTEKIIFISHEDKSYYEGTVDEFVSALSGMESMAMEKMKESMKDMPPEQRKMMEQMMQRMKPKVNVRKTGKTSEVLGYKTVIYETEISYPGPMGGKIKTESYIAPDLKFVPSEISKEDAERVSKKFEKLTQQFLSFEIEKMEEGFTLKTVTYGPSDEKMSESEAVSIKKGDIPSNLLKIPKGYKKKNIKEMMMYKMERK